jgi:hypothetical protein
MAPWLPRAILRRPGLANGTTRLAQTVEERQGARCRTSHRRCVPEFLGLS